MRRLTESEYQEKKAKGLCFKCDEKWEANHMCKKKELSVLLAEENDSGGALEEDVEAAVEEESERNANPEVSLYSTVDLTQPKTMRLKGKIDGR